MEEKLKNIESILANLDAIEKQIAQVNEAIVASELGYVGNNENQKLFCGSSVTSAVKVLTDAKSGVFVASQYINDIKNNIKNN